MLNYLKPRRSIVLSESSGVTFNMYKCRFSMSYCYWIVQVVLKSDKLLFIIQKCSPCRPHGFSHNILPSCFQRPETHFVCTFVYFQLIAVDKTNFTIDDCRVVQYQSFVDGQIPTILPVRIDYIRMVIHCARLGFTLQE